MSKISHARAAHLSIGDPLFWAVVTLLQGKSCYMLTVIPIIYCKWVTYFLYYVTLFVVNVANTRLMVHLTYLKVARFGNFGDLL